MTMSGKAASSDENVEGENEGREGKKYVRVVWKATKIYKWSHYGL